jgi:YebC/PmpR family DNA-binding regulatory protein
LMLECMTNNRNRTVGEVRHALTKHGGNLGTDGSVAYLFKKQGQLTFSPDVDAERLMEFSLELGALDISLNDDRSVDVITSPETYVAIKQALIKADFLPEHADITMLASTQVSISDKLIAEKVMNLIDVLEDLDDVQAVYTNADILVEL